MAWDLSLNFAIALLAIANPLGKLPIWVKVAADERPGVRYRLATMVVGAAAAVLFVGLLFGRQVLEFFSVDLAAFRVAGGIVLLLLGWQMLQGQMTKIAQDSSEEVETTVQQRARLRFQHVFFPMAFPLVAGPGTITTVIVYSSRATEWATLGWLSAVLAGVLLLVWGMLLIGHHLVSVTGSLPLEIMSRIFGLLLMAIAMQFVVEGLGEVFPTWLQEASPIEDDVEKNQQSS